MLTPENTDNELKRLENALLSIPPLGKIPDTAPSVSKLPKKVMPIRQALLSVWEKVDADKAVGRICAFPVSPFPPEVPIVISGEEIDQNTVSLMKAYGIENVFVVKK
jgi:arginine/lysine/ornithine decarboxylase